MVFLLALPLLLLAGCIHAPREHVREETGEELSSASSSLSSLAPWNFPEESEVEPSPSSISPDGRPLEMLPSELSIPHFREMRLSGTGLTLGEILARTDAYTRYAIAYRSNGLRITGIMNIPKGDGPFPLLILNHGYIDRNIYTQGRGLKREQDFLARAGFVVLHTDYRGHAGSDESPMTENVYDGNLEYAMDSANAILAAKDAALPQIDTEHVGMFGHSLGGGVTLAILTGRADLVDAAVLYAPVHANVWENFSRWRAERDEGDRTIMAYGTPEENPVFWNALSPQTYLNAIEVPILLFQGGKDADVPKEWSDALSQNLRHAGKDLTYIAYPAEGHEFSREWTDCMEKTVAFFREHLR